jgi:hypothetical protein
VGDPTGNLLFGFEKGANLVCERLVLRGIGNEYVVRHSCPPLAQLRGVATVWQVWRIGIGIWIELLIGN